MTRGSTTGAWIILLTFLFAACAGPASQELADEDSRPPRPDHGRLQFVVSAVSSGHAVTTKTEVRVYETSTVCKRKFERVSFFSTRFYFEPGSTTVADVTGEFEGCADEKTDEVSRTGCMFARHRLKTAQSIELYGYSWPLDGAADRADALSRRRIQAARGWIEEHVDTPVVAKTHPEGMSKTNSWPEDDSQVLGAFATITGDSNPPPSFQQRDGPRLATEKLLNFAVAKALVNIETSEGDIDIRPSFPDLRVKFRPSDIELYKDFGRRDPDAFLELWGNSPELRYWIEQMFEHDCQASTVAAQKGMLDFSKPSDK